jgi:hypothetical protein
MSSSDRPSVDPSLRSDNLSKLERKVLSVDEIANIDVFKLLINLESKIKETPPKENKDAQSNIAQIKLQCDEKYANQLYFGAAALNRMIILDSTIVSLLTPETLIEIFRQQTTLDHNSPPTHPCILHRTTSSTTIARAIQYAFMDGLQTIESLPNNNVDLRYEDYINQKIAYQQRMPALVSAMVTVASKLDVNIPLLAAKEEAKLPLTDRLDRIVRAVDNIIQAEKNRVLLYVPGFAAESICEQSEEGFHHTSSLVRETKGAKTENTRDAALHSFASQFITHPEIMVNGFVSHMFYDRVHFEACLAQKTEVNIGEHKFQLREVLRAMVTQCEERKSEPAVATAVEQFSLRMALVENDLSKRFASEYAAAASPSPAKTVASPTPVTPSITEAAPPDEKVALKAKRTDEKAKVDEFIKIYTALREGQTSVLGKSRGLLDKENLTLRDVEEYAKKNPDSRTKIAFDLMQKYHRNFADIKLVGEIYQYSYGKSTIGSRSRYKKGIFNESIAQSKVNIDDSEDNTRTAKIMRSLKPNK